MIWFSFSWMTYRWKRFSVSSYSPRIVFSSCSALSLAGSLSALYRVWMRAISCSFSVPFSLRESSSFQSHHKVPSFFAHRYLWSDDGRFVVVFHVLLPKRHICRSLIAGEHGVDIAVDSRLGCLRARLRPSQKRAQGMQRVQLIGRDAVDTDIISWVSVVNRSEERSRLETEGKGRAFSVRLLISLSICLPFLHFA